MTTATTINIAKLLTNGVVTEFPFSFKVFEKTHLTVILRTLAGAVVKTYAQNEFSVSGLGENAGTVTIVPAPANNHELIILRTVPLTQDTDIINQGGFFPKVIEKQFDLLVMQTQQLDEKIGRAIVSEIGETAYEIERLTSGDYLKYDGTKLVGVSLAELSAPAEAAAAEAQGYVAALLTYTFGYIGIDDDTPPAGVDDGEGFIYTMNGRIFGAINNGGVADVKFELLTKALADSGGAGVGTVISVAASGGTTGLTFAGGPITSSGTFTLGGTLAVEHGGTGANTATGARANLSAAKLGANEDITSMRQSTTIAATGTIAPNSLGFRGVPLTSQAAGSTITLGLDDAGKRVANTSGGWTIPANAVVPFPVDTSIMLYNNSSSSQTISITSDTLRWSGTANVGTRTLAQRGMAVLVKVGPTEWVISGDIS